MRDLSSKGARTVFLGNTITSPTLLPPPLQRYPLADLTDGEVLSTVAGNSQLVVSVAGSPPVTSLNGSVITSPDHDCSNGIVHRMGSVIGVLG